MMPVTYTTSLKTWARAVSIDSILIGALVAGAIYHVPYVLEVSVFFMWWLACLGIASGLLIVVMPSTLQATIKTLQERVAMLKAVGDDTSELYEETTKKLDAAKLAVDRLWSVKMVNRLAASRTYLAYHWITDIVVWSLLIIAGHPILATFKVASFLISCILIGVARKLYRERLGIKTPDDIEEEFAKHRQLIRQTGNVVNGAGDKITK